MKMDRSVWTINNKHFTLILDAKTESGKVSDRKFSPGEDIWTNEIPQLKFEMKIPKRNMIISYQIC